MDTSAESTGPASPRPRAAWLHRLPSVIDIEPRWARRSALIVLVVPLALASLVLALAQTTCDWLRFIPGQVAAVWRK